MMARKKLKFLEFFAGGGMARVGLGDGWECLLANDFCPKKNSSYRANFSPAEELVPGDVAGVVPESIHGRADLVWGSFPCQDLSLAGNRKGLKGERSGSFWSFWKKIESLAGRGDLPKALVLENVLGTITANDGEDFSCLIQALQKIGYQVGALVIDAVLFVPQSRPRLFVVGVAPDISLPDHLVRGFPHPLWQPKNLVSGFLKLPKINAERWVWWDLPVPPERKSTVLDVLEDEPDGVAWHPPIETEALIASMSDINRSKVERAKSKPGKHVGTVYKRTRLDSGAKKIARAEVRFDGISGCLRTPGGGSSRQTLMVVEDGEVRSRLISPREAARLMGLPDSYKLPCNYNEAYHLLGDGVAVPVVAWLENHIIRPAVGFLSKVKV